MGSSLEKLGWFTFKRSTGVALLLKVEAWDSDLRDLNVTGEDPAALVAELTISDDNVRSLAYELGEAGYYADGNAKVRGFSNEAVGFRLTVVSGSLYWATNGTSDGSEGVGNGVETVTDRPSPSTLRSPIVAGDSIVWGVSREN